ncbi:T9SS type A sorting domain-containing protein [Carboxylicivirga caseinilyticus]|uniref:T9SS type A sorting domain-containing protein n=1 Tax=Carboxylicivirga caseinilyticus TaxID=3417572 RepID=UPI003D33E64B|nr:T9SS type A sorting domain-containing protein [Marinilabiliaceae bacterium A049]
MKRNLFAFICAISFVLSVKAGVIYVKPGSESTAWSEQSTIYTNIQSAINAAQAGDEIWLAEGTYYVTEDNATSDQLLIQQSISIYGGFSGSETLKADRNWNLYPTIISGDIGVAGDLSDNTERLIRVEAAADDKVVIDGVILEKAFGSGGIVSMTGDVALVNVIVRDNHATSYDGGGVYNRYSTLKLVNCLIYSNESNRWGAGVYQDLDQGSTTLINCTVVNNHSNDTGGGLFGHSVGNLKVYNSIVWGNTANVTGDNTYNVSQVEYSCLEDAINGTGNINDNPLFVDESANNYNLTGASPAIGAASNDLISETKDLNCHARVIATVDMGAMEYIPQAGVIYVKPGSGSPAWSGQSVVYTDLQSAISAAQAGDEIWLAEGTYYVTEGTATSDQLLIQQSISIYGGFSGLETSVTERNFNLNPTIISGDIGVADDLSDNTERLIRVEAASDDKVVIDGVILEKAYGGGGIVSMTGDVALVNVIVRDNHATSYDGGGVYNRYSALHLVNCLIYNNVSNRWGAGVYQDLDQGSTTLINCTVVNNHSNDTGGGLFGHSVGNLKVYNSIVWGNTANVTGNNTYNVNQVEYSCLEDAISGAGNINDNPLFVDATGLDFHQTNASPCIDAASNSSIANYSLDLDFSERIKNNVVDMGVYETTISTGLVKTVANTNVLVYPNPIGSDNLINIILPHLSEQVVVTVYDLSGKLIVEKNFKNVSSMAYAMEYNKSGVYLVNIQYDDQIYKCKLVVK